MILKDGLYVVKRTPSEVAVETRHTAELGPLPLKINCGDDKLHKPEPISAW